MAGCSSSDSVTNATFPKMSGHLIGLVYAIGNSGEIIQDLDKVVISADPGGASTYCDTTGAFDLKLETGTYDLKATRDGFGSYVMRGVPFLGGGTAQVLSTTFYIYQRSNQHVKSISVMPQNPNGDIPFVFYVDSATSAFFTSNVKLQATDILPELGPANHSLEEVVSCSEVKTNDALHSTSVYPQLFYNAGFTPGTKIYYRAAVLNGSGYYDPILRKNINDTEGPWSDYYSFILP